MKATRSLLMLVVAASLVVGACTKKPSPESTAPTADNSAQPSQPAADNTPQASQPSTDGGTPASNTRPAAQPPLVAEAPPPPPKPKPRPVVIPAGTVITVRIQQTLGSKTSHEGDRFDASLAEPITIGGNTVVPAGSSTHGKVTQAHAAGRFKGGATLGLALTNLRVGGSSYAIQSTPVSQTSKGKGKRTAVMIGGGAGGGALIGGLAGGGKGAAIGALIGAGAGTMGSAFTGNRDISLPAESALSFQLTAPLTLKPSSADSQD